MFFFSIVISIANILNEKYTIKQQMAFRCFLLNIIQKAISNTFDEFYIKVVLLKTKILN